MCPMTKNAQEARRPEPALCGICRRRSASPWPRWRGKSFPRAPTSAQSLPGNTVQEQITYFFKYTPCSRHQQKHFNVQLQPASLFSQDPQGVAAMTGREQHHWSPARPHEGAQPALPRAGRSCRDSDSPAWGVTATQPSNGTRGRVPG